MIDPKLFYEGRTHLEAVDQELLPLDVDRGLLGECFVCDRNGLEFAVPREADRGTAELIAWAINNLSVLLDELEFREVALERLKRAVEQDFAAKQDHDRARKAKAVAIVKQHANYQLAALVEAALEGTDA